MPEPPPMATTIVARNYLPAAIVLVDSYRRYHPDAPFAVLVVDAADGEADVLSARLPGTQLLIPEQLGFDQADFARMAMSYSVVELCTALKPCLLRCLLADHDTVIYLDPDIEVFAPFAEMSADLAAAHAIALTPHVLEPIPRDSLRPSEADILASGAFNLGFIAVSRDAAPFLRFWTERLRQDAISAVDEQLFTDQRWVDYVPSMFRHVVIDDPGYNVAYWNVYQRPLDEASDGTVMACDKPLRFLHYSGYQPERPWLLTKHFADRPRVLLSEQPLLAQLSTGYRDKLLEAGYREAHEEMPYRWGVLADGTPIPWSLRRVYREAWMAAEREGDDPPPSPFGPDGHSDFLEWATSPATARQRRVGLNPWAMAVWQGRSDLREEFPQPLGADSEGFRSWCTTSGVSEGALPAGVVTEPPQRAQVPVRNEVGANVLGYLTAELGVGELGRLVHDAIRASGIPIAALVDESTVQCRTEHPLPADADLGEPMFGVSVVVVNADMTPTTLGLEPELARDRYVIGVWAWELSDFPPTMHRAFDLVDEVWAISDFCAGAIAQHAPVPVHVFPVPVRDPGSAIPPQPPADGQTRFLFVFDHASVFERKNPIAAIEAFQRAFLDRADARLTLKSINGDKHPVDRERLRAAVSGDKRIELIESYFDHDEMGKLFMSADCYLSLHRSEGFGITVAEAMAHGLPVIATDYSSTTEFLTADIGWPVPYRLVPVRPGNSPYPPDAHWAEPNLDAAVAALREVADNPHLARRRGAAARQRLLTRRSFRASAEWAKQRVLAAHESWRRSRAQHHVGDDGPLARMRSARQVLASQADPRSPSLLPAAPAFRRVVLRALNHYDEHQRHVLGTVMDAAEGAVGQLVERLDQIDHKLMDELAVRDRRIDHVETATRDLQREVSPLQEGLRRHHDLLSPGPAPPTKVVATDVGMLRLPADDNVILPWLQTYGTWETLESRLIDLLLPSGGGFVDIGAHVGYHTVRALRRVGAGGFVIAVEPWEPVRALLEINVATNVPPSTAAALTVLAVAAWDGDGPQQLALSADGNSGDNRISPDGTIEVTGMRLDAAPELADRRIDVVKTDAQGRDHRALAGMVALFEARPAHILCEFDPAAIAEAGADPADVLRDYRLWGYQPLLVTDELVRSVEAASGVNSVPGPATDADLIAAARDTAEGFVTLWLRPDGRTATS